MDGLGVSPSKGSPKGSPGHVLSVQRLLTYARELG